MKIVGRYWKCAGALALAVTLLAGCKSKEEAAIEAAKKQAAATGQAQQVVSVDKKGNVTTVTVQPPAPGQTAQQVTTTVTPAAAAAPTNEAAQQAAGANSGQPAVAPGQPAIAGPNGSALPPTAAQAAMPVPGGPPVIQPAKPAEVTVPAGTNLTVRINQHISVKSSRAGDHFDGEIAEPVMGDDNQVVIPKGAPVDGIIVASHKRGHFKGASILELRLTSLSVNGTPYRLDTRDLTRTKKGKGKRSAAFIGGGSGLGMLIGGVASGGTGLLIGGLAGGGAGTAIAGLTGNRDIEIPAESIVHFKLSNDLTVRP